MTFLSFHNFEIDESNSFMSNDSITPTYNKRSMYLIQWSLIEIVYGLCNSITDYQILNEIGKGTYGFVYKGRRKSTGEIVALKKIKLYNEGQVSLLIWLELLFIDWISYYLHSWNTNSQFNSSWKYSEIRRYCSWKR